MTEPTKSEAKPEPKVASKPDTKPESKTKAKMVAAVHGPMHDPYSGIVYGFEPTEYTESGWVDYQIETGKLKLV